jgi:hypothetical protein
LTFRSSHEEAADGRLLARTDSALLVTGYEIRA